MTDGPPRDGTPSRNEAYRRLQSNLTPKQRTYYQLMRQVAAHGKTMKATGEVVYDLTDMEAARWLTHRTGTRWERTSINGRRNELSGGSGAVPGTEKHPLIVRSRQRRCGVTGNNVTAWRATLDLFSQSQLNLAD